MRDALYRLCVVLFAIGLLLSYAAPCIADGKVIFDAAHGEDPSRFSDFISSLEVEGYIVVENYDTVDSSVLSGASVFMVVFRLNDEIAFSPSEITAIDNFVRSGGGLLVAGVNVWDSNKLSSLWKQTYPIPINKSIYYFYPFFR